MKTPLLALLLIARTSSAALVYDTKVELRDVQFLGGKGGELRDFTGVPLTIGAPLNGDGAQLQYGYFSLATLENPFLGAFIPLTGEGSHNGYLSTVGDGFPFNYPAGPGQFFIGLEFAFPTPDIGFDLPIAGTPMALRFFDGTTIEGSTHFNTVANSSDAWDWAATPKVGNHSHVDFTDPGMVWEGGEASAFRTTLSVPEPSAVILMITAVIGVGWTRHLRSVRLRRP